ncbi:MAG: hypothetical protein HYU43_07445, partial [Armatimonadetes bacterium]|nr:hypothetical protein [Armatimonadota bacterium]
MGVKRTRPPGATPRPLPTALGVALALLLAGCAGKNAKPSKSDVSVLETEPTWTTRIPYAFSPEAVKLAGHPEAILVDGLTAEDETRRIVVAIDPSAGRILWERELGELDTYEVRPSQTVFY